MDSDICIKKRFGNFLTNEVILFQEFHSEIFEKAKSYNSIDKDDKRQSGKSVEGLGIQAVFLMANKGHLFFKNSSLLQESSFYQSQWQLFYGNNCL